MQTNTDTPKPRNSSWWDAKSDDEKRAHIAKMTAGRQRARKAGIEAERQPPANGNGQSPRNELAAAFETFERMEAEAAELKALDDAKRALTGNSHAKPIALLDAVLVVQDALERGELELGPDSDRPSFYRVTRERIA